MTHWGKKKKKKIILNISFFKTSKNLKILTNLKWGQKEAKLCFKKNVFITKITITFDFFLSKIQQKKNHDFQQPSEYFINSVSQSVIQLALRRRHAKMVRDSTSSYKIDYVIVIKNFLNPKGHQNPISGSKVTAILLKGWILSIGGSSSGRVCACSLRSRLVFNLPLV